MPLPLQLAGLDEEQIAATDSLLRAKIELKIESTVDTLGKLSSFREKFVYIANDTWDSVWHFGFKLLVVVLVFLAARWIIGKIVMGIDRFFESNRLDSSLRTFIRSLINIVFYLILFYLLIAYLGFNTSLFVALFAAAGLAIGMAMSGVFQNFAGGVMILLLKPFHVGDWIECQGQAGKVVEIRLFNTVLRTADNQTILLPNGSISSSIVTNTNEARTRRVEWTVALEYGADFDVARGILMDIMKADKRVLADPSPTVDLGKLGDTSIQLTVRCWVKSDDFWGVFYAVNAVIYKTLPEKGFNFPYLFDVALHSDKEGV